MPTNENTYNSRVTSEALEAKFRQVFPSQGGAELVDDLYASGVIQPVIDFSSVAEGTQLGQNLQTAWDFSTGKAVQAGAGTTTAITNAGFWQLNAYAELDFSTTGVNAGSIEIFDGTSGKTIWEVTDRLNNVTEQFGLLSTYLVVFLRSGDSLRLVGSNATAVTVAYRQIADVNGTLVNPLGFTFS